MVWLTSDLPVGIPSEGFVLRNISRTDILSISTPVLVQAEIIMDKGIGALVLLIELCLLFPLLFLCCIKGIMLVEVPQIFEVA